MAQTIRPLEAGDREAVLALSLRAWAPVFASLERILGPSGVFAELHPDWRVTQRRAVQAALDTTEVRVADVDGVVAGFVAVTLPEEGLGEIYMIAVDPAHQRRGIGSALIDAATTWMRSRGCAVALIGTGGDPGHAPARAAYDAAGFTPLPIVNYFKKL